MNKEKLGVQVGRGGDGIRKSGSGISGGGGGGREATSFLPGDDKKTNRQNRRRVVKNSKAGWNLCKNAVEPY